MKTADVNHGEQVGIVVGIAAMLLLAGCTASSGAVPTPAATKPPATTPNPTPTPVADPSQVRVPFDCDALYTAESAKPLLGTSLTATGGKDAPLQYLSDVAQRQSGGLDCTWGGGVSTEFGPADYLAISIAPDAAADYDAHLAAIQPAKQHPITNTAGDKSSYYCKNGGLDTEGYTCFGELVVGGHWASVSMSHVVPIKPAALAGAMQKALEKTAATLVAAPTVTLPAWSVPSGPAASFCLSSATTARLRTAVGDATVKRFPDSGERDVTAATIGQQAPNYADCFWTSKKLGTLDFSLLDGGAWAFPTIRPVIPIDSTMYGAKFEKASIAGASSALVACKQGTCEAYLAIDQAAVQIDLGSSTEAATLLQLAKLVAVVKAT